jgi:hypothetical protein
MAGFASFEAKDTSALRKYPAVPLFISSPLKFIDENADCNIIKAKGITKKHGYFFI